MNKNYIHEIIATVCFVFSLLVYVKPPPRTPLLGIDIFLTTTFILVTIWFLLAWRRNDVLSKFVKIFTTLGMRLAFFSFWTIASNHLQFALLTKDYPRFIRIGYKLSEVILISFVATIFINPLLLAIYRKRYICMSLII